EREPQLRVERAEEQLEHAVVARADELDANRPEPAAEQTGTRRKLRDDPRPVAGQLRRKRESIRHLLCPATELLLRRKPIAGRVQLDGREPARVEGEETRRVSARRVETGLPRGIGPAGGADRHGRYTRRRN